MVRVLEILTTAYLGAATIFFVTNSWKVRENRYHLFGNAVSRIFSMLAILLIWR